jgi:UDPglucose 6-dehydrogenase
MTNIAFIGLGKLGLPLACCLAEDNKIYAVDKNEYILNILEEGNLPFYESGLKDLFTKTKDNFVLFTNSIKDTLSQTDASVILVNTQLGDGGYSDEMVKSVIEDIAINLKTHSKYHLIILSSTVPPGSIKKLIDLTENISNKKINKDFGFVYVPDFVKLGTVINDFKNPDFFLVGSNNVKDTKLLNSIWENIHENNCTKHILTLEEAEIAKIALNAYIVNKISFANFLGLLCDNTHNVNVHNITSVIGLDKRISPYFFKFGTPYGGTCFPRDVDAFIKFANTKGKKADNLIFAKKVNELSLSWLKNKLYKYKKIGILGYSFKPDTPVIIESASVNLAKVLLENNCEINVYDKLNESLHNIDKKINIYENAQACIDNSDIVVIMHPDKYFKNFTYNKVLDPWGILE